MLHISRIPNRIESLRLTLIPTILKLESSQLSFDETSFSTYICFPLHTGKHKHNKWKICYDSWWQVENGNGGTFTIGTWCRVKWNVGSHERCTDGATRALYYLIYDAIAWSWKLYFHVFINFHECRDISRSLDSPCDRRQQQMLPTGKSCFLLPGPTLPHRPDRSVDGTWWFSVIKVRWYIRQPLCGKRHHHFLLFGFLGQDSFIASYMSFFSPWLYVILGRKRS